MAAQPTTQALAPFREGLQRSLPHIQAALPSTVAKYLTPERMTKIVLGALSRNHTLLQCTPNSVLSSVMESAALGLEPTGGALGQAYLVPYRNKGGAYEAQLIIGYRGLITLARRSGEIQSVEAHIIRERDHYRLEYGLEPKLEHRPILTGERGEMVAVYCVARFRDGGTHVEVMTRDEIDAIRKRSRASSSGPWVTDYEEMAKKTVVRRASKYWPLSTEMARAMDLEDAAEAGDVPTMGVVIDGEALPVPAELELQAPKSKTSKVKQLLEEKKGNGKQSSADLERRLKEIDEESKRCQDDDRMAELGNEAMDIQQALAALADPVTGELPA